MVTTKGDRLVGLGNIGPEGALPVMEGKSVLFKVLGDINAIPLRISTHEENVGKQVEHISHHRFHS